MICSAKELGINDKLLPKEIQEGILVLPEDTPVGQSVVDLLGLNDEVLELDLTPNRSDCLSMIGVAYEIAAILGRDVRLPDPEEDIRPSAVQAADRIQVKISAREHCAYYAAGVIDGVRIGPSPLWMQNRLIAAGVRPINNIVDITNYVMLEYGQPLHAFDADRLAGGVIEVRLAREGETFQTLDGQERLLTGDMLLITDGEKPIALAGVMGGANSEVTEKTGTIILESARFLGSTVRQTSRKLGLRSEASLRFEKEVNPETVVPALRRAAGFMARYAGGSVANGVAEAVVAETGRAVIDLSLAKVNRYLGTNLPMTEAEAIIGRLQFAYERLDEDTLRVEIPGRRGDLRLDVDLIEEIARLYGYDQIPTTLIEGTTTPGSLTKSQKIRRELRTWLTGMGFDEVVSYSFTHPERTGWFPVISGRTVHPIRLSMPMSEERSVLRTSLLPGLLEAAAYNRNRKSDNAALFEIGAVFLTEETDLTKLPEESTQLALLWTGRRQAERWNTGAEPVDFYDVKGVLEALFHPLGIAERIRFKPDRPAGFHPGRSATIWAETKSGLERIGHIGQIHPDLERSHDLSGVYAFELALEPIYRLTDPAVVYKPLPRYPSAERDLAVVLEQKVEVGRVVEKVKEAAGEWLESVNVFDVYTGDKLGGGRKSVALSLAYRHPERTLTDEEISELHARVISELEQSFGAELRK
jgi:phenylalanyl-tRNA synthetase beta chain